MRQNTLILCSECQAKLQTFKERCEDELKFLKEISKDYENLESDITDGLGFEDENDLGNILYKKIQERISDLKEVLK